MVCMPEDRFRGLEAVGTTFSPSYMNSSVGVRTPEDRFRGLETVGYSFSPNYMNI
jgi:hypothetical protein